MSWKQKTVVKILLLIAWMIADEEVKAEVKNLANHISTYRDLV